MTLDPAIAWTLRLSLALLFATAAWHKLSDRAAFAGVVRAYELVPLSFAVPLSWLLPSLECVIAVGLVLPELRKASAIAAGGLLSLYTFAIAASLWRGKRDIDCGCFGFVQGAKTQLSPGLIARNLLLVVASGNRLNSECSALSLSQPASWAVASSTAPRNEAAAASVSPDRKASSPSTR